MSWMSEQARVSLKLNSLAKLILLLSSCSCSRKSCSVTGVSRMVLSRARPHSLSHSVTPSTPPTAKRSTHEIMAPGTTSSSTSWLRWLRTAWRFFRRTFMLTDWCCRVWISLLMEDKSLWKPLSMPSIRWRRSRRRRTMD